MSFKLFRMKLFQMISLTLLMFTLVNCEPKNKPGAHVFIKLVNNSDKDVYFVYGYPYLDSLCDFINCTTQVIVPANTENDNDFHDGWYTTWEDEIRFYSSGIAAFYIFDCDSVKKFFDIQTSEENWDMKNDEQWRIFNTELDKCARLALYYYSIDDLEWLDWTITYP